MIPILKHFKAFTGIFSFFDLASTNHSDILMIVSVSSIGHHLKLRVHIYYRFHSLLKHRSCSSYMYMYVSLSP